MIYYGVSSASLSFCLSLPFSVRSTHGKEGPTALATLIIVSLSRSQMRERANAAEIRRETWEGLKHQIIRKREREERERERARRVAPRVSSNESPHLKDQLSSLAPTLQPVYAAHRPLRVSSRPFAAAMRLILLSCSMTGLVLDHYFIPSARAV